MKTSLKWIKSMVPGMENVTPQEYMDAMTLSGSKVEFFEQLDGDLEKIVVGQIKDMHAAGEGAVLDRLAVVGDEARRTVGSPERPLARPVGLVLNGYGVEVDALSLNVLDEVVEVLRVVSLLAV